MKLILPNYVKSTLNSLHNAGFEAWIVGGSVRDSIMKKSPQDYDITTSAKPKQVIELFEKTVPTGIKHGTVTVLIDKNKIEVTTYRTESGYNDSRHPDDVTFVSDVTEDLSRRDFTVNAIAYNDENGIYDPFCGLNDIENRILKTVGDPKTRFEEDALRIMRLFRFSSQLEFKIDPNTFSAAEKCANALINVSPERIREELIKTLCGSAPTVLNHLLMTDALSFIGLTNKHKIPDDISHIPAKESLRFSYFCFINNINTEKICRSLHTSNAFLKECDTVCQLLSQKAPDTKEDIKRILSKIDIEYFRAYLKIYEAINNMSYLSSLLSEIIKNEEPYKIDMLKISGEDLIALGYSGKRIGKTLEFLLERVIENPEDNFTENLKTLL